MSAYTSGRSDTPQDEHALSFVPFGIAIPQPGQKKSRPVKLGIVAPSSARSPYIARRRRLTSIFRTNLSSPRRDSRPTAADRRGQVRGKCPTSLVRGDSDP